MGWLNWKTFGSSFGDSVVSTAIKNAVSLSCRWHAKRQEANYTQQSLVCVGVKGKVLSDKQVTKLVTIDVWQNDAVICSHSVKGFG